MPHLSFLAAPANPAADLVGVRNAAVGRRVSAEAMLRGVESSGGARTAILVVMKLVETILLDERRSELVADAVWEQYSWVSKSSAI